MRRYKIEVHSNGYEDYAEVVEAKTLRDAKRHELRVKAGWMKHNDIDGDENFDLPFSRVFAI